MSFIRLYVLYMRTIYHNPVRFQLRSPANPSWLIAARFYSYGSLVLRWTDEGVGGEKGRWYEERINKYVLV